MYKSDYIVDSSIHHDPIVDEAEDNGCMDNYIVESITHNKNLLQYNREQLKK